MRKLSKVIIVLLSLVLALSGAVIAASASGESNSPFYINGEPWGDESKTLSDAIAAANGGVVKLNADVNLTSTLDISGNVRIDLGGKTVTSTAGIMFNVANGASFELRGKGTLSTAGTVISASNAASIEINAFGSGITVNHTSEVAKNIFTLGDTDSTYVSGKLTINPKTYAGSYYIFDLGGTLATEESKASLLTVEGAEIVLNYPTSGPVHSDVNGIFFITMKKGSKLRVNHSDLSLAYGNFVYAGDVQAEIISVTETNNGVGVNGNKIVAAAKESFDFAAWVDIDDSEIRAFDGGFTRVNHTTGWGKLFNIGNASIEVKADNTVFEGGGRSITASEDQAKMQVLGNKFYFTNVDYSSSNLTYSACWIHGGDVNMNWNGGRINHTNAEYSKKATITIPVATDTDSDVGPYGNLAKEAVRAALGTKVPADFDTVFYDWYFKSASGKYEYYTAIYKYTSGQLTYRGWVYSEVNGTWYGQRFANLYIDGAALASDASTATNRNAANGLMVGTDYTNSSAIDSKYSVKTYAHAFLDKAPSLQGTQGSRTSVFNPTTSAEVIEFNDHAFDDRFGGYKVVYSDGLSNGYVKAYVDKTNYKVGSNTNPSYMGSFTRTGGSYTSIDGKTYIVQEMDISTDSGRYTEAHAYAFLRNAGSVVTATSNTSVNIAVAGSYTPLLFKLKYDGKLEDIGGSGSGKNVQLPTDGTWTRMTLIYEIKSETSEVSVTTGEFTASYNQIAYTVNTHVFLNGEWLTTLNKTLNFHESKAATQVFDSIRFNLYNSYNQAGVGNDSSFCLDNPRLSFYTAANSELAALCANPASGIGANNTELMIMPDNNSIAFVDGVGYKDMNEAFAAADNGSTVDLRADVESLVTVNKNIKIITNGHNVTGFISDTHRVVNEDGIIYLVAADSDEIVSVDFINNDVTPAVNESYTAAFGTTIKPTTDFSSIEPTEEHGFFVGWTLFEEEDTLVVPEYYKGSAIAIYEEPAILHWYDAQGEEIKTTISRVGAEVALPDGLVYDAVVVTNNGWYDLKVTGWTEALSTKLTEATSYELHPDIKPIAPADGLGVKGILINVAANVDFDLNVYIPAERPEAITRVRFVNANGSSVNYKYALDESGNAYKDENGDYVHEALTVYGKPYEKYIDPYGVADSDIRTYKLVYTVDGEEITQTIEYGLPYYASAIMNSKDDENIGEDAKNLVMYMINYSTAVAKQLGDTAGEGYSIYSALMDRHGSRITNVRETDYFVSDEQILADIAKLNYKNSTYISSASFYFNVTEPVFVFKYSDAAEDEGLQRPNSNNFVGWSSDIFVYFMFANEDNARPTRVYAYNGTIENGTLLEYNDENWHDYENNSYYIFANSYRHHENKSLYWSKHSIYNILEPVSVIVQRNDDAETKDVNEKLYEKTTYSFAAYLNGIVSDYNALLATDTSGMDEVALAAHNAKLARYEDALELGLALYAYAEAADKYGKECEDNDSDHLCDYCDIELSVCTDADMNNECDICGKDLSYKYVVVIGVDGAGAFFADADTPNIDRIFANGAKSYNVLTETPSISAQCWGSILHGVKSGVHGRTNTNTETTRFPSDSKIPSFLRVVRENDPDADIASFTNWANINYGIVEEGFDIYKGFDDPSVVSTKDADVTAAILAYLESASPAAMFVQFDEVDGAGHGGGYGSERHLDKINTIDAYIGQIYDAYVEKGIINETLFIVTADHGGTPTKADGSVGGSHGGDSEAEMRVMFAAAGKTVVPGTIGEMEIRDTAAVVLYALGYDRPSTWTAVVPSGIFEGVEAPDERPVYVDKESERYHETEPTPVLGSDGDVTNFVDKTLVHYFPFDNSANDAVGSLGGVMNGNLYWINSYYGKGVTLDDGYISVSDFSFGDDDWTISVMVDTRGAAPDPVVIGNKDWKSGKNPGFVLCINQSGQLLFNAGDGTNRFDYTVDLPENYKEGYFNVILSFDRTNSRIRLCADFGELAQVSVRESIMDAIYAATSFNIGQDGTGNYYPLSATLDELMFFRGVFGPEDVVGLASYFGKTVTTPADPDYVPTIRDLGGFETPAETSDGHINSYVEKYIGKDLILYTTFDGDASSATGQSATASEGISYEEGFFGEAVTLKDGKYVAIDGVSLGAKSTTFAFWYKSKTELDDDPPILAGKSWSGAGAGFVIATNAYNRMWFNLGNGSARMDVQADLPVDFTRGWVHVIVSVDKENATVKIYLDFAEAKSGTIPDTLLDQVLSAATTLYVGNEGGSRQRENALDAALDELMIFDGSFTENDVRALSKYYGVEELAYGDVAELPEIDEIVEPTLRAPADAQTPVKGSAQYVDKFVSTPLSVYLAFDGNTTAETSQTTGESGAMSYEDGVFGQSLKLQDGNRVTVNQSIGTESATYAFWIKLSEAPTTDVVILASKKWSGATAGFAIATSQWKDIRFNLGNGSKSHYTNGVLPGDAYDGWMHVMVVVDRENGKVRLYLDFQEIATTTATTNDLPEEMATQALAEVLYIGNDARNGCTALDAAIDELMIFDGALTADDARALSRYYGVESLVFGE